MMENWKSKVVKDSAPSTSFLAPDWYIAMKNKGVSESELFKAVKHFCQESTPNEPVDDSLVRLMLATYDA